MKLYVDPRTINCRKVLAAFHHLGTEYESVPMDWFSQEFNKPEYLAINPNASLPALVDGDFVLWESNAILQYAADKQGRSDFYPTDLRTRTDINRWLLWEANQWFPTCYVYLTENLVKPFLQQPTDTAALAANKPRFHRSAGILEQRLSKQPWIAGNSVTIADIACAAPMHLHAYQKLPLENYPGVRAWMDRVEALPCWQATDVRPLIGLQ